MQEKKPKGVYLVETKRNDPDWVLENWVETMKDMKESRQHRQKDRN